MRRSWPFLFVILACLTLTPTTLGAADEYALTDPRADTRAGLAGSDLPGAGPDADLPAYMDIVKLSLVDKDEQTLEMTLENAAGFKGITATKTILISGNDEFFHEIRFDVPGSAGSPVPMLLSLWHWRVRVEDDTNAKSDFLTVGADMCLLSGPDEDTGGYGCGFSSHQVPLTIENGKAVLTVSKILLTQQGHEGSRASGAALRPVLMPGDELTSIHVRAVSGPPLFETEHNAVTFTDRAPDSGFGDPFPLSYPTPTGDLRITVPAYAVVAGEPNVLSVQVDNLAPVKRIVNFSVENVGDQDWSPEVTSRAVIAAGASTNLTLRLAPPALGDQDYAFGAFRIKGDVVTQPGTIAMTEVSLVASRPLDAQHNVFYALGGTTQAFLPVPVLEFGYGWLLRTPSSQAAQGETIRFNYQGSSIQAAQFRYGTQLFALDGIPNPAQFRPGEPIQAHLEITSQVAMDVELGINFVGEDGVLGTYAEPASLVAGTTKIDAEFLPSVGMERLDPRMRYLMADVSIQKEGADGNALAYAFFPGPVNISLEPGASHFTFPIDRLPPDVLSDPSSKISLAAAEDLDLFVNPGRTAVVEFDLRNEGGSAKTVEIALEASPRGWDVAIRPGERFRIQPGQDVRIGVELKVPRAAKEGELGSVPVVVRDAESDGVVSRAVIKAVVTSGVDIPDETFEARSEDESAVDQRGSDTPGTSGLLGASLVIACAFVLRRRHPE